MKRREFLTLVGGAAVLPVVAHVQAQAMPVIGFLQAGSDISSADYLDAFRDAMRQLGYIEGHNIHFESRFAGGVIERLPDLAAEVVGLNPTVIVSGPLPANLAVQKATSKIPIVMGTGGDPVRFGLVKSL